MESKFESEVVAQLKLLREEIRQEIRSAAAAIIEYLETTRKADEAEREARTARILEQNKGYPARFRD